MADDLRKMDIVDIDLNKGHVFRSFLSKAIGMNDSGADIFGVNVFRDGEAVDLSGATVQGFFRDSHGNNIAITSGNYVSGNTAYVVLPQPCYNYDGQFVLAIKLIGNSVTGTMRIVDGKVDNTNVGGAVAPVETVPTYQEVLAVYDDMVDALADVEGYASNFAPEFVQGTANAAGTFVMKDGVLYLLPEGHTAGTTWANTTKSQSDVGTQILSLKSAFDDFIDDTFTHGRNLFNYRKAELGYLLRNDGSYRSNSAGYISEYIPVEVGKTYNCRWNPKSNTYANVCFYDSSYNYLSYYGGSSSNTYFTVPVDCAYIRICGSTADGRLYTQMINEGDSFTEFEPYNNILLPNCGGADDCFFVANRPVCYSREEKKLFLLSESETGTIYLHIPGMELIQFTSPITLTGSGNSICYDIDTNTFSLLSIDSPYTDNIYRIGNVDNYIPAKDYKATNDQLFIVGNTQPVLTFDMIMRTVDVNIPSSTFIWYKKTYSAIPTGTYTLDLETQPNHFLVYFDLYTKEFSIGTSYSGKRASNSIIPIADVYGSNIQCVIPYEVKAVSPKLSGKTIVTYGDSLTYYDGHAFTWGEFEGETCYGYQSYLRGYLGATVTNRGHGGRTTPQITARVMLDESFIDSADYIILMPSIDNDDRSNHNSTMYDVLPGTVEPIGGEFDFQIGEEGHEIENATGTTAGSIQAAIEYIYSVKPDVRIVIMVEPKGFTYYDGVGNLCNEGYSVVIREVAKLYGIPVIDLWDNSGINELTKEAYYADPPFGSDNHSYMYHPNNWAWSKISRIICKELAKY